MIKWKLLMSTSIEIESETETEIVDIQQWVPA